MTLDIAAADDRQWGLGNQRASQLKAKYVGRTEQRLTSSDRNVVHSASVEPQVATFSTFEEADEADARYYASLSGQERLEIVVELASRYWGTYLEDSERLARVYRVDELSRR